MDDGSAAKGILKSPLFCLFIIVAVLATVLALCFPITNAPPM